MVLFEYNSLRFKLKDMVLIFYLARFSEGLQLKVLGSLKGGDTPSPPKEKVSTSPVMLK